MTKGAQENSLNEGKVADKQPGAELNLGFGFTLIKYAVSDLVWKMCFCRFCYIILRSQI